VEKVMNGAERATSTTYDIAFIGSGLSSSFTMLRLLEGHLQHAAPRRLELAVIEQSGEFFTGIPYGRRSGATSLTITPLNEFLPAAELERFLAWLVENRTLALDLVAAAGGLRSTEWLARARKAVDEGTCGNLHVPRYLFGRYLTARVNTLLAQAKERGVAGCTLVPAEVTAVERTDHGYTISVDRPSSSGDDASLASKQLVSQRVVVGIGMPPTKKLFPGVGPTAGRALLIDDPYLPDIDETLRRIEAHVLASGDRPDILVIGANAGCLEMLYHLSNVAGIHAKAPRIHVLSPQGRLPERYKALEAPRFVPTHLQALAEKAAVTAKDILDAARLDVAAAKRAEHGISDSLPTISRGVGALLGSLNAQEKLAFATFPGVEIGRLQRRAGDEYCDVVDDLAAAGRLEIVAGVFVGITTAADGTAMVSYVDSTSKEEKTFERSMSVVVNCSGASGVRLPSTSRLIDSLLRTGLFRATESSGGFVVNDRMEACDGLYVNGPLLSGNVVADRPIWHVEHCGRIINFSTTLAGHLLDAIASDGERDDAR
jgi:uncharacterized NAD(P)/FAD-binding protein YdhS